jgi:uncharacterized caspase-like protein
MPRYALLLGNCSYSDPLLPPLRSPRADAEGLAEYLLDPRCGAFDQVDVLIDAERAVAEREIRKLFANKLASDVLLLYFSGHGVVHAEDGSFYLATPDTDYTMPIGTAIEKSYVKKLMEFSKAKGMAVVLDCCYSGAFVEGFKGAGDNVGAALRDLHGNRQGCYVITATSGVQAAQDHAAEHGGRYSLFTGFLLEGLQSGTADVDQDGLISFRDAFEYVSQRTVASGRKQKPQLYAMREDGPLVLARSRRAPSRTGDHQASLPKVKGDAEHRAAGVALLMEVAAGSDPRRRQQALEELKELLQDPDEGVVARAFTALLRLGEIRLDRQAGRTVSIQVSSTSVTPVVAPEPPASKPQPPAVAASPAKAVAEVIRQRVLHESPPPAAKPPSPDTGMNFALGPGGSKVCRRCASTNSMMSSKCMRCGLRWGTLDAFPIEGLVGAKDSSFQKPAASATVREPVTLPTDRSDGAPAAEKTVCIMLVRGENPDGSPIFAYVAVRADKLPAFMEAQRSGNFFPEDHGVIIEAGEGEPSPAVRRKMEEEYGFNHQQMMDVPDTKAANEIVRDIEDGPQAS